MLTTLDVPYIDTTATELVWTLDQSPMPALASMELPLDVPGGRLELRILGASHQVVLDSQNGRVVETVACLRGEHPDLPATVERRVGGRTYRFHAHIEELPADRLHAAADSLRRKAKQDGDECRMILAEFPAHPDAITALQIRGTTPGVSWQTWHVYPNSRQIVTTSTEVL